MNKITMENSRVGGGDYPPPTLLVAFSGTGGQFTNIGNTLNLLQNLLNGGGYPDTFPAAIVALNSLLQES